MKIIYIAGPYRAPTPHGILENIRRAEALAIQVWQAGFMAFCPHLNSAFFDGLVPDSAFLSGTMEMLKRCDAVILTSGWIKSEGTHAEIRYCRANNVPIFNTVEKLVLWREIEESKIDPPTDTPQRLEV